jgi:hypothetical protein
MSAPPNSSLPMTRLPSESARLCVRHPRQGPPSAQSPFAHLGCYPPCRAVSPHVSGHYSAFIATTNSCASPKPSGCLQSPLGQPVFAGCCQPRLGVGPSRRYLCESFPACLDPYPGCPRGALARFFPRDNGLPAPLTRSALGNAPYHRDFGTGVNFEAAIIR